MQAGFAMVCAGAVRKKNVQNTMLKNLLDACGASLAFFTIGYAFAFGGSDYAKDEKTFVGSQNFFLIDVDDYAFFLFQYAFSAASATIVAGTLAERCQMAAYLCYSFMLTGWVYPVIAHSIWSPQGFLSAYAVDPLWGVGLVDFAGSGVVHTTGGITALFATIILGPRRGRFHDEEGRRLDAPRDIPGHSMALQVRFVVVVVEENITCVFIVVVGFAIFPNHKYHGWGDESYCNSIMAICLCKLGTRISKSNPFCFLILFLFQCLTDAWNLYPLVWMVWFQLRNGDSFGRSPNGRCSLACSSQYHLGGCCSRRECPHA